MAKTFIVSISCPDQVGLVSAITGKLFEIGANLGDTSFATLGSGSEFSTVCNLPDDIDQKKIKDHLSTLEALKDGNIRIESVVTKAASAPKAESSHRIILRGQDNPGLVAKISEVFAKYEANIVQLNSETVQTGNESQYVVTLIASIPEAGEAECKAAVQETAQTLGMQCKISAA